MKTEQKSIQNEKELFEKGLFTLQKELLNILKTTKQVRNEKTNTFILKTWEHFLKYGDINSFRKLFFIKLGNMYLYNKLQLAKYFNACDIAFDYDAKKDILRIAYYDTERKGKPLKCTFLEYLNMKKESLTAEQKERKLFERLSNMNSEQKTRLLAYLKNN